MCEWPDGRQRHPFWERQPVAHTPADLLSVKPAEVGNSIEMPLSAEFPGNPPPSSPLTKSAIASEEQLPGMDELNPNLHWCRLHIDNPTELADMVALLGGHYVEDAASTLRFAYSTDFLRWALADRYLEQEQQDKKTILADKTAETVHANREASGTALQHASPCSVLVVGIRDQQMALRGCIAMTLMPMRIEKAASLTKIALVNFLCVDRALRGNQLAQLLIKKLTQLVHAECGVFQALFSTERMLPAPITTCRYWHYPLRVSRLIETGFIARCSESVFSYLKTKYAPERIASMISGGEYRLRPFQPHVDAEIVAELFEKYHAERFEFRPTFGVSLIRQLFAPKAGVIYAFLLLHREVPVAFGTFYALSSKVLPKSQANMEDKDDHFDGQSDMSKCPSIQSTNDMNHLAMEMETHVPEKTVRVAYLYYVAWNQNEHAEHLLKHLLVEAQHMDFDVFNCLHAAGISEQLLDECCGFLPGDGFLR